MKKIKRCLAALLIVCILISISATNVSALTSGTSYSFNTKYTSVYYNWGNYQTANGEYHSAKGQLALRTLKSTGEPIYCLQAHEATNGDAASASLLEKTSAWQDELSNDAKNGITQVSIFGYPNYNYGYNNETAQIATQMLIWEFQTNNRKNFTAAASSKVTNAISGNNLKCYNKILEACRNRDDIPSFSPTKVKLKGTGESNAVTVSSSVSLNNFEITSTPNGAKASISGNKLKIWATKSPVKGTFQLTKKFSNKGSSMCLTGANQTMFYGSVSDPVNANITVELSTGSLALTKTSEDGKVDGFTFRITGSGYDKTAKTDSNGKITLSGLQAGTYKVEEINLPAKYVQPKSQTVTVEAGKTATVSFSNKLTDGECSVLKTNEANDPLVGVEFTLYTNKACTNIATYKNSTTKCVKTTDSNGKIEFKPLAQGTYYLKETALPADLVGSYEMSNEVHTVDLTNGGKKTVSAINYMKTNVAVLLKECEGGGYIDKEGTLANVEGVLSKEFSFIFTRDDGEIATARSWYDSGIIGNLVSKSDGSVYTDNEICSASDPNVDDYFFVEGHKYTVTEILGYQRYAISEKETTDGAGLVSSNEAAKFYVSTGTDASDRPIINQQSFTIPNGTIAADEPFVVKFSNNLIRGNINVVKTSDDNLLEGFDFYIHGTTVTGEEYSATAKTDSNGKISFTNLLAGTYTIEEINRPLRYADSADNEPQTVTISKNGETKQVNFDNPLRSGKLGIIKSSDDGIISNVKFKVTSTAGYSKVVTTGSTGKAQLSNLPVYDSDNNIIIYTVEEVDTPIRYHTVKAQDAIVEEDTITTVKFKNTLKYSLAVIRKQCEDGKIEGVSFTVTGSDGSDNTLVTDENGECSIELPIYDSNNNLIQYRIHEVDTPDWYLPVADKTITLTLDEPTYVDIVNVPKRGNVRVSKVSDDNIVDGFKFRIYGTSDSGIAVDETRTTNSSGVALFENILVGTYTLEEVDTPIRYITPTAKEVIVSENGKTYYFTMFNSFVRGSLKVQKISEDGRVEGVSFTVTGSNGSKYDGITDSSGIAEFFGLQIYDSGNNKIVYTVTENKFKDWYILPSSQDITLNAEQPTTVYVNNVLKRGNVNVQKIAEDGTKAGFKIRLYGTSDSGIAVDETRITDSNGIALFENILVGNYTIEEVDTPARYLIPTPITVAVSENGTTYYRQINNVLKRGNLVLHKVNTETGEALSGAEFAVYEDVNEDGKYTEGVDTVAGTMTETATTGEYLLENLKYGKYLVKETKAPEGFYLDETYYPFSIIENGKTETVKTVNNGFGNEPIKGTVRLIKADGEYKNIMLSGAEFTVYKDIDENGEYTEGVDTKVGVMTETEKGVYELSGLKHGKYLVKETKAPTGFRVNPSYYVFVVDGLDDYTAGTTNNSKAAAPTVNEISVAAILDIKKYSNLSNVYKSNEWSD